MFLIKHFVASTIHLGQKINKWNPRTSYFLLGMRDGIFVIDLEQTLIMLKRALTFIKKICSKRGYVFYIPNQDILLENESSFLKNNMSNNISFQEDLNLIYLSPEYYSSSKQRGMLYAFTQKRKTLPILSNKKSTLTNNTNLNTFTIFIKPEVLFMLHVNANTSLVKEAVKLQIPIIGVLSSSSNPYAIQYPIPGNDDSKKAFFLYTELLINSIIDSKKNQVKSLF